MQQGIPCRAINLSMTSCCQIPIQLGMGRVSGVYWGNLPEPWEIFMFFLQKLGGSCRFKSWIKWIQVAQYNHLAESSYSVHHLSSPFPFRQLPLLNEVHQAGKSTIFWTIFPAKNPPFLGGISRRFMTPWPGNPVAPHWISGPRKWIDTNRSNTKSKGFGRYLY